MRTPAAVLVIGLAAVLAGGCNTPKPPSTPQSSTGSSGSSASSRELAPIRATTTLIYVRSGLVSSPSRPIGFNLIRDYRHSNEVEEFPGRWNDATQTLSADVSITLKTENLVFVDDSIASPGAEMNISAGRSRLPEVACPESVYPEHGCYLLQLLR